MKLTEQIFITREALKKRTNVRELRVVCDQLADEAQRALRLLYDAAETCERGTDIQLAAMAKHIRESL